MLKATTATFFDKAEVPVETIEVVNSEARNLAPQQFEVIGQKTSYRLSQRPGSFVVLKYMHLVETCRCCCCRRVLLSSIQLNR